MGRGGGTGKEEEGEGTRGGERSSREGWGRTQSLDKLGVGGMARSPALQKRKKSQKFKSLLNHMRTQNQRSSFKKIK